MAIYDAIGQRTKTLVSGQMPAGAHAAVWDGRDESGAQVGNGVYFYRIQAGESNPVRRMLLLK